MNGRSSSLTFLTVIVSVLAVAVCILSVLIVIGYGRLGALADDATRAAAQATDAALAVSRSQAGVVNQQSREAALTAQVGALANRLARDERQTCRIQARGLPADHDLVQFVGDVGRLLAHIPKPRHASPLKRAELTLTFDLRAAADEYARIESQQPPSRSCP